MDLYSDVWLELGGFTEETGMSKTHMSRVVERERTGHVLQLPQRSVQRAALRDRISCLLQISQRQQQLHNGLNLLCDLQSSEGQSLGMEEGS